MAFENLFGRTPKQPTQQSGGRFTNLFAKKEEPTTQPVEQPTKQPVAEVKTIDRPFLKAQFLTVPDGTLTTTPRGSGSLPVRKGFERDHIVPVALGGTSNDPNLQFLESRKSVIDEIRNKPIAAKDRQEGKMLVEWKAINDFKAGTIGLNEARQRVLNWDKQPKKEYQFYAEEFLKSPVTLAQKIGGAFKNLFTRKKKEEPEKPKETREQRAERITPEFLKKEQKPVYKYAIDLIDSYINQGFLPAADLITERVTKPLLKGELPGQKQVIGFLEKGREGEAKKRLAKNPEKYNKDASVFDATPLEMAKSEVQMEDLAFGFSGGLASIRRQLGSAAKSFLGRKLSQIETRVLNNNLEQLVKKDVKLVKITKEGEAIFEVGKTRTPVKIKDFIDPAQEMGVAKQLVKPFKKEVAKPPGGFVEPIVEEARKVDLAKPKAEVKVEPKKVAVEPVKFSEATKTFKTKLSDALKGEAGVKEIVKREANILQRQEINNEVVRGIKNNPIWQKEKAVKDIMGEGWKMSKGDKVVVATPKQVESFLQKGYKKDIEIDSLAKEAGFDRGIDFLENQVKLSELPTTPVRKTLIESLTKKDPSFAQARQVVESVKGEKVRKSSLLLEKAKSKIIKSSLKERRKTVRAIQDFFNLTDSEIKKVSRKDVGLMNAVEWRDFVRGLRTKAESTANFKSIRNEIQHKITTNDIPLASVKNVLGKTVKNLEPFELEAASDAIDTIISKSKPESLSVFDNFVDRRKKFIIPENLDVASVKVGDKSFPAVRKSGFFARKSFETAPMRDNYKQTLSPTNMALNQGKAKLGGDFGAVYNQLWRPVQKAIAQSKIFKVNLDTAFKNILKKYKIKITAKNGKLFSDYVENKVKVPQKYEPAVKEIRSYLNKQRGAMNEVRERMGKQPLGFIQDYIPHMQKTGLWNDMINNIATISDNLDFITPNQVKNPFAEKRILEELPNAERNLFQLVDRYNSAVAKDLHESPAIEHIKAHTAVMESRGLSKSKQYWDEYIRTGLVGKSHKIDSAIGVGIKGRKVFKRWNNMVNLAFLSGKVAWNVATQPLSYLGLTTAEAGFWNSAKAVVKYFDKGLRKSVRDYSTTLQTKSADTIANAVGEGRGRVNSIYRSPIDKYNDLISVVGSAEEKVLTELSYIAGLDKAKQLGYRGKDAQTFADIIAERTQSMYNKENRPLIGNSDVVRFAKPFQSFSLELWNHVKEFATKSGGGFSLTKRQRVGKLLSLMAGVFVANEYAEWVTGRKKTTVGSFIPYFGEFVDRGIAKARKKDYIRDRSPLVLTQQFEDAIKGWQDYVDHGDTKKLRKIGVNFGLALGGIGGGSQINNIIDGTLANISGDVRNVKGQSLFKVDDTKSRIKAPIFGVWSTEGGREYWETPSKTKRTYNRLNTLQPKEREKEFNALSKSQQTQINYLYLEDHYNLNKKLRELRNKSVEERAQGIKKYLLRQSKANRLKLSEQLEDVGILTKEADKRLEKIWTN